MSEVIICPLCGFSFKYSNTKKQNETIKCPMCGYVFRKSPFSLYTPKEL